jgi:hypothetical protein
MTSEMLVKIILIVSTSAWIVISWVKDFYSPTTPRYEQMLPRAFILVLAAGCGLIAAGLAALLLVGIRTTPPIDIVAIITLIVLFVYNAIHLTRIGRKPGPPANDG